MPVDIRATVACSLGTVISGSISDEYVQGTGLIKCSGSVVINAIITPAVGTAVTFSYTKSGVTRSIPRKLRVLSSFADPFRRITSVELGCKLTYLSDKRDSIDWTAFDDAENTLTAADAEIITIPIRAQAVAAKCMAELGITGTFTLTNQFSIAQFDLSPGYVQVLSDLLVSESLCGYLDANETLQVFSLDQAGGTGPVLDATQLVDIGKIGVGSLPGEAVVVSYSSLKLKRDVNQGGEGSESPWDRLRSSSKYTITVPYEETITETVSLPGGITNTTTARLPATKKYKVLTTTDVSTSYIFISTSDNRKLRLASRRSTRETTSSAAVAGAQITDWLNNGIPFNPVQLIKDTTETFRYDKEGNEVYYEKVVKGSLAYLTGALNSPFAFSGGGTINVVSPDFGMMVSLEAEERETYIDGNYQQVTIKRYAPWSSSLSGQQSIARNYPAYSTPAGVFDYFANLVADQSMWSGLGSLDQNIWSNAYGLPLVEQRVELQRRIEPVGAPTNAEINNSTNAKGGDASNGYRTESKAELALALGSATAQRRIELSLPYAPDDTFTKSGSTYGSVASDAEAKAQLYGIVQNRLLLGNRNGMSLQTSPEVLPGAPFAPFLVRSGSTSALYRTNGTSWTFDAQGLVVSTDALFWGGVGGNAGESWFPIAPGITTLPTTPPTTTVNIVDANGNVVGSYEQTTVTGTVPVAQETRLLQSTLRVRPVVTAMGFAMQEMAEVAITTKVKIVVGDPPPPDVVLTDGNASPVLGVGQVDPTTTATNAGWTLIFNNTADEASSAVTGFNFTFKLNSVSYTACYVTSNAYLTFTSTGVEYQNLGAAIPAVPKLHFGSDDFSYQRVYTKLTAGSTAIRWEGNTDFAASAGVSNRFAEITFYRPNSDGKQYIDVRFGNLGSTTERPFMIATASSALASFAGALTENASYVFEGNATGTTWTAYTAKHIVAS